MEATYRVSKGIFTVPVSLILTHLLQTKKNIKFQEIYKECYCLQNRGLLGDALDMMTSCGQKTLSHGPLSAFPVDILPTGKNYCQVLPITSVAI